MSGFWCTALLLAVMQLPGQNPPWTPNPAEQQRSPEVGRHLPSDEPPKPGQPGKRSKIDMAQTKRDAEELVRLAGEIPPAVEQANQGVLPTDLNDRLKRIEKLSKQLRREILQ